MIQIGDKCIYTGENQFIKTEAGESILLCSGDKVTILWLSGLSSTEYVYTSIEKVSYAWLISIKELILVEDFPEDHFPDVFYMQNRKLLMKLHD